ncbi:hypothetical protein [Sphingomonas sp.]|uniref:hypothetical protein n=1 Tax=Sphingomonas sp. TaxID=28214 RepID=UPI002CA9D321|nr:hypothetical protein [Sphingomonas sp.]HWK36927.1 hypothetical protein [Sphingomonas sp.]
MSLEDSVHSIRIDPVHNLIEAKFTGYFTPEVAREAGEAVRAAIVSLGNGAGQHLSLYDVSEANIAPGETIELLQRTFADPRVRPLWARRVAYFTPSTLARLQLQRLRQSRDDIGVFADRDSALAWLIS